MSDDFISSVKVETKGAHEHVSIWVRGQLVGKLVTGPFDGERIKAALLGANVPSLALEFHVLYHLTARLVSDLARGREVDLDELIDQLRRLRPTFDACTAACSDLSSESREGH
jgi:hypothetical protein